MPIEALASGAIGWFGKLPAAGDFLRRNLPGRFVDAWDGWLQAGMAAAASERTTDWQEHYLRFPVWHFLRRLPAPDASPAQELWAGVLAPSVDRVGRLFPLTVAFDLPAALLLQQGVASLEQRLHDIETLALQVLGNDDLAGFEEALAAMPALATQAPTDKSGDIDACTPAGLIEALGRQGLLERLASHALFWDPGAQQQAMLLAAEPLQADAFCKLALPAPITGITGERHE